MTRQHVIPLLAFALAQALLGSSIQAGEAQRGPSTPEERRRALELIEQLETSPSSPEAKEATSWLTAWLVEVPDIKVKFCLDPLGRKEDREGIPAALVVQQVFSQAAFLINNPGAKSGTTEAYLAGVEGTLRSYGAMKSVGKIAAIPALEELLEKQAKGDLERTVKKRAKRCK